jgi:carbon monoxide dehydrogenase subunit G
LPAWFDATTLEAESCCARADFAAAIRAAFTFATRRGQKATRFTPGKASGAARPASRVNLMPIPGGAKAGYDIEAILDGVLAQAGVKLMSGIARKMAVHFFKYLDARLAEKLL